MDAISHLNDSGGSSRRFFSKESVVRFNLDSHFQEIIWNDDDPNKTKRNGDLNLRIFLAVDDVEKGADTSKFKFDYENIFEENFSFFNKTISYLGLPKIEVKLLVNEKDIWNIANGTRIFKENDKEIELRYFAQGYKSFNDLRFYILEAIKNHDALIPLGGFLNPFIVIVEEPENNLHPDLQKKIPNFLDELSKEIKHPIFFFVSTHSPFVISSASKFENQKTFLIDDGALIDLEGNKILKSSGLSANQCAVIVSKMLGADVTDIGYPENYCIIEEYSMQVILNDAKKKGLLKDIQFVSGASWSRSEKLTETIESIVNTNTLLKCNPFYSDKYLIILDNLSVLEKPAKARIDKIKARLANRFIELSLDSIEEYYCDFKNEIYLGYIEKSEGKKSNEKGVLKEEFAFKIASLIKTKQDFSQLFKNELDILLKNK